MCVGILELRFHAPYAHSLKEKRMIVKSLIARLKNKFNLSVFEAADQDLHQIIVISIAALASHAAACDSILDQVIDFAEANSEAELIDISREIIPL